MTKSFAVFQTEPEYRDTLVAIFLCDFDAERFCSQSGSDRLYTKRVDINFDEWSKVQEQGESRGVTTDGT